METGTVISQVYLHLVGYKLIWGGVILNRGGEGGLTLFGIIVHIHKQLIETDFNLINNFSKTKRPAHVWQTNALQNVVVYNLYVEIIY